MSQPHDAADDHDLYRHTVATWAQLLTLTTQMLIRDLRRDGTAREQLIQRAASLGAIMDTLSRLVAGRLSSLTPADGNDDRRQAVEQQLSDITSQVAFIDHHVQQSHIQRQRIADYADGLYQDVVQLLLLLEPEAR